MNIKIFFIGLLIVLNSVLFVVAQSADLIQIPFSDTYSSTVFSGSVVVFPKCEEKCGKGIVDSCASKGGVLNDNCECFCESPKEMIGGKCVIRENIDAIISKDMVVNRGKVVNEVSDCNYFAKSVDAVSVDYSEGLKYGLSAEESCKSYVGNLKIQNSGLCGKESEILLYAYFNKENGCCAGGFAKPFNPVQFPETFCGYLTDYSWKTSSSNSNTVVSYRSFVAQHKDEVKSCNSFEGLEKC